MATSSVLTFVIVGHDDHPIFEADLTSKAAEPATRDVRRPCPSARVNDPSEGS